MPMSEPLSQLATRIPTALHREVKLACVKSDTSVMDFVVAALRAKLGRGGGKASRPKKPRPKKSRPRKAKPAEPQAA